MRYIFVLLLVMTSLTNKAVAEQIKSSENPQITFLSTIENVHSAVSRASELKVKLFDYVTGDAMNAHKMALSVVDLKSDEGGNSAVFELDVNMESVKRITFVEINKLLISYMQTTVDEDGIPTGSAVKNMTAKIIRNSDHSIEIQLEK